MLTAYPDFTPAAWLPSKDGLLACSFGVRGANWDDLALAGLWLGLCWYGTGLLKVARRRRLSARDLRHAAAFLAGVGILLGTITGPLAVFSHELFSMHMVQHMMVIIGAAPLIVCSRPSRMFQRALPPRFRKRIRVVVKTWRLDAVALVLLNPVLVWIAFCAGFVFWHAPGPYALGMRHGSLAFAERLTFLFTSLAFWAVVIPADGKRHLGYGARLLFLLSAAVLTDLPGALMVFAPRPLYPEHAAGVAGWGLTLMQDQEIAGLVMWIPGGLMYLAVAARLFLTWLRDAENRATLSMARSIAALTFFLCIGALLTSCNRSPAAPLPNFNGSPDRGAALIRQYGCGGCHDIPSIRDAEGNVGPPLSRIGTRVYIAGVLRNTPDNMSLWIRDPQQFVPGNAMPQMNIPEQDARDITAYLYTLK
ncbi:MAG: cytochrome c oxidase assembly protein [Hyphomicrobiales bacterium]|nr:cytochrome c oxidase assembly protein [Hyphomicrobiales bacterium]